MARIRVPQQDGSIAISVAGDPATEYPVTDGVADVPTEQISGFLARVPGAQLEPETPADETAPEAPAEEG